MARKLKKLQVLEVSAVNAAASPGARVLIRKRNYATPTGYRWNDAYNLVPVDDDDGEQPTAKITDADRLAAVRREIADNYAAVGKAATEDHDMEHDDIIGTMSDRVSEIAKATGCSDEAAMMRLAESRAPEDQALWREFKLNAAPASTAVGKEYDPNKSLRKMQKRVDQILATDPSVHTRESAIAKVASSRDPADLELWQRYRASDQTIDSSPVAPVGKADGVPDPLDEMTRVLQRVLGCSTAEARRLAIMCQRKVAVPELLYGTRRTA